MHNRGEKKARKYTNPLYYMQQCNLIRPNEKRQQAARSGAKGRRNRTTANPTASAASPRLKVETKAMQKAVHVSKTSNSSSAKTVRTSARPAKPPRPVYCVCRSSDIARFMIACDNCQEWFHGDCVSVTASQAERIIVYYCETCRRRNRRLAIQYKPAAASVSPVQNSDAKHRRRGRPPAKRESELDGLVEDDGKPVKSAKTAKNATKKDSVEESKSSKTPAHNGDIRSPSQRRSRASDAVQLDSSPETRRQPERRRRRRQQQQQQQRHSPIRRSHREADDGNIEDNDDLDGSIGVSELVPDDEDDEDADVNTSGGGLGHSGIVVPGPDPPSLLSSPSAAAAAAAAVALGAVVDSDVDDDDDGGADKADATVVVDADDLAVAVEEEMLLPAEDESATDDELETSGFRPPQLESDAEQDQNSLLDEDDFASTSVFRFPKRCGYCEACRLKSDCGRCEVCQAKKRYPSFKLDSVDCLARQCRTMAKLGGRLGSLPFPIQKRGRGRPSKASLSNEYFLYMSAGARPRRRDHSGGISSAMSIAQHQRAGSLAAVASLQSGDVGRKRRHQPHRHLAGEDELLVVQPAAGPMFCTPYGLSYPDHSYCKHHASGGWQRQSPQPVSQLVSPSSSSAAAAVAAAVVSSTVASASASATIQQFNQQHHQQLLQQQQPQHQQAFYTLNDDTDNLEVTWPEEAAA